MAEKRLERLYERLLNRSETNPRQAPSAPSPPSCRLHSLAELHFLDWHACALITRRPSPPLMFTVDSSAPAHISERVAAHVLMAGEGAAGDTEYQPGDVLAHFLSMPGWSAVWRDYQTSRDQPRRAYAGATLDAQFPHLRAGFLTGIDHFQMGEYYAAHEDWESLWVRLGDEAERRGAQALIQLASAHIHRLKGRPPQARKLYETARRLFIAPAVAATLDWLDAPRLLAISDEAFDACRPAEPIPWPAIPLRPPPFAAPRKHR